MPTAAFEPVSPPAVLDFLERHVSPRGRTHWQWKYQLDHGGPPRAFYHVDTAGEVGGFVGMLPTMLETAGGRTRAAWFVDWATRPGEGSVGAGVALLRRAEAATDVLLTLQGSADTQKILPKLRWSVVETPAVWILRSSARSIVTRGRVREWPWLLAPALAVGAVLARLRRVARRASPPFAVVEVDRFPASYDAVWEARRAEFVPLMERSSAALNFMCADFPGDGYLRYVIRDGGDTVGHLVLRVDVKDGSRRGRLVDALWPRGREGAAEWVVREACAVLQSRGVDYIECTAAAPDLEQALAACRFARLRPVPIWYHRLPDGVATPDNWYVTYLDCDRAYR